MEKVVNLLSNLVRKLYKILKTILFIPVYLTIILMIFSSISLFYIFYSGLEEEVYAYIVYLISFYTLTLICVISFKKIPVYYKKVKNYLYNNQYAKNYLTDVVYKTHINIRATLGINMLYVLMNVVYMVIYNSWWFGIIALYYLIMAIMNFLLASYISNMGIGKNYLRELKRARVCACILVMVNIILSGFVLMMIYYNRGFNYRGYLIYVIALYTFYITIIAIVNLIKYRKYKSPIMLVSKIVKLAAAMFSMLFLETAMFSQFGSETSETTKKVMIILTGAGICVIIVGLSIYTIVRVSKDILYLKNNE